MWGAGVKDAECRGWGRALTQVGFYLANVDPGHTVGVSNSDQEDPTSLRLRPPGLAFHRHPQSPRNPPSEFQARRLFEAYLLKGKESGASELHPIG